MLGFPIIKEGFRIYSRARKIKKTGFKRYKGDAAGICRQIVRQCYNGMYFQASCGNFAEFYIRDFGICAKELASLGYRKEVIKTLQYALNIYSSNNTLTTTITEENRPVHVFSYSPDSLPFLLRSLRVSKATELIEVYRPFIEQQTDYYLEKVLDRETGLVRAGSFSSMKDNYSRESSCYDNCMMAMMSDELGRLKLYNPFRGMDIARAIKESFWNNSYFYDDLKKHDYVAGDANTFPFWCKVSADKSMLKSCINAMQKACLDSPFPLKYTSEAVRAGKNFPLNILLPDYETDSVWMHLGLCYLDIVKNHDKRLFAAYMAKYKWLIEQHGNFLELFNPDGSPFIRRLYASDESMLWASKYLYLRKFL